MKPAAQKILAKAVKPEGFGFLTIAEIKKLAFEPKCANLPVLIRCCQNRVILPLCAVPAKCAEIEAEFEATGNYVRDCALAYPTGMKEAAALVGQPFQLNELVNFDVLPKGYGKVPKIGKPLNVQLAGELMAYGISPEEALQP